MEQDGYDLFCNAANAVAKIDLLGVPGTAYCTDTEVHAMAVILKELDILPHVTAHSHNTGNRLDVYLRDVTQIYPRPDTDPLHDLKATGGKGQLKWDVNALRDLVDVSGDFEDTRPQAQPTLKVIETPEGSEQ
ncbi:MAG: hypothetical protein ACWA40_07390 [Planktomarina sp.]